MSDRLFHLLQTRPYLLADGAMGTNLFAMGLESGDAPELWNTDHPERIAELHRRFIEAGSDIILTNSFGGNHYRLKRYKAPHRVDELNETAARIACREANSGDREVLVAGAMGPTGELFTRLGALSLAEAQAAFSEQAQALARGGVDLLWIETLSSQEEVEAAVAGAASTGLPIICTLSFDTHGRTRMGLTPSDLVRLCHRLTPRPIACGANCGVGPAETVVCILNMADSAHPDDVLVAKANCGIPEFGDGALRYAGTPALMAEYARLARAAGARIIGGCCGTTPDHIRAMKAALDGYTDGPRPDLDTVADRLGRIAMAGT
jgi:methionine synthase I (cobalamin-dependent)